MRTLFNRQARRLLLVAITLLTMVAGRPATVVVHGQFDAEASKRLCFQMPDAFWTVAKPLASLTAANCTATLKTGGGRSPTYGLVLMAAPTEAEARQLAPALPCVVNGIADAAAGAVPFGGPSQPSECHPEPSTRFGDTGVRMAFSSGVMLSFARGNCIVVVSGSDGAPEQYVDEYAAAIDQTIKQDGCAVERRGPEKSTATILSIPKHRAAYRYELSIPRLPPVRTGVRNYEQLHAEGAGELEIAFVYQDRSGTSRERAFRVPIQSLISANETTRARLEAEGKMMLLGRNRLVVAYEVLDELEKVVRDPANVDPATSKGLDVFRGSALAFRRELRVYDRGELVARSDPADEVDLRYEIKVPVVFVPGTAGSRLETVRAEPIQVPDIPGLDPEARDRTATRGYQIWPAPMVIPLAGSPMPASFWRDAMLDREGRVPGPGSVRSSDVFRSYILCERPATAGCVYELWFRHMFARGYREDTNATSEHTPSMYMFPYDWRLDVGVHSDTLDATVQRALVDNYNRQASGKRLNDDRYRREPTDKVVLIGHSQGGLVIRSYLAEASRAAKVETVVLLASPNHGTPKVFRAFATTGYGFDAPFITDEIGKYVANNWPAAYFQTLVTQSGSIDSYLLDQYGFVTEFRKAAARQTHVFCLERQDIPCQPIGPNMALVDRAEAFHRALPNPVDKGIPTFVVGSMNVPTIVAYRPGVSYSSWLNPVPADQIEGGTERNIGNRIVVEGGRFSHAKALALTPIPPETFVQDSYSVKYYEPPNGSVLGIDSPFYRLELPRYEPIFAPCGDNLVPVHSLLLPGATMIYTKDIEHGKFTETPIVQGYVDDILSGRAPRGEPEPTCNSRPAAVQTGLSILGRGGRFNLEISDATGARAGHVGEGQYERAIAGATLDGSDRHLTIALPSTSGEFRLAWTALDTQPLDVEIVGGDGVREQRVAYASMATTPNTRGELRFRVNDLSESLAMQIDRDGDGRFEASLSPTWATTFEQPGWSFSRWTRTLGLGDGALGPVAIAGTAGLVIGGGGLVWLYRRRLLPSRRLHTDRRIPVAALRYGLIGSVAVAALGGAFFLGRQTRQQSASPVALAPPAAVPAAAVSAPAPTPSEPVAPPNAPRAENSSAPASTPLERQPPADAPLPTPVTPPNSPPRGGGNAGGIRTARPVAPGAARMVIEGRTVSVRYERSTAADGVPIDMYFYMAPSRPGAPTPPPETWNKIVRQPAVGTSPTLPVVWFHAHWEYGEKEGWRYVQEANVRPPLTAP